MGEDRVIRTALIGYGVAGEIFHAPLIASTPGFELSAIVTRNEDRRARARRAFPNTQLLADAAEVFRHASRYDLVVVASPNRSHVSLALESLRAGQPVVVDKPLAPTVRGASQLVDESLKLGVPLTVFQNRRWDGDFLTLSALIGAGVLGPLVRYESRFERYRPQPKPNAWRESADPEEGGGLLLDLGSHLVDQALQLFGRPLTVYAEVGTKRAGALVDDDTFIALAFDVGPVVHLWMNTTVRILGPRFRVSGLSGSYVKYGLDPQETDLRTGKRPGSPGWGEEPPESWGRLATDVAGLSVDGTARTLPGRYESFYAGLYEALLGRAPLPVDPRDALQTLEIIEAARISASESRIVTLDS